MFILVGFCPKINAQSVVFTEHLVTNNVSGPAGIFISDLDNDGKNDIICAAANGNEVAWWHHERGNPVQWTKYIIDNNYNGAIYVFAEDIDGGDLSFFSLILALLSLVLLLFLHFFYPVYLYLCAPLALCLPYFLFLSPGISLYLTLLLSYLL